jgi:biopolymer transport protein TolR
VSRRRSRRLMNQINVVPYIDVTLVLLVIFMITAPMTNPGVVELPKVGQALKQAVSPVVLTVKTDKSLEVDGQRMARDEALYAIRQKVEKNTEQSVVIAADKSVRYEDLVSVMDMLKQGHVDKVGLLLQPSK